MNTKEILGSFDGQHMVTNEGMYYPVSGNYASKSKLVEGDRLKLSITDEGNFIYKQISPVLRKRVIATVTKQYEAMTLDQNYFLLKNSINYFRLQPGETIVILIPEKGEATWAALENVIRDNEFSDDNEELNLNQ